MARQSVVFRFKKNTIADKIKEPEKREGNGLQTRMVTR